jgi:uncharacterized protein YnzC (UPF0291/DUF896 family)
MQIFTSNVDGLTKQYKKERDDLAQSYVKALGKRLKVNSEVIAGIEKVQLACVKEKNERVKENNKAEEVLRGIANG